MLHKKAWILLWNLTHLSHLWLYERYLLTTTRVEQGYILLTSFFVFLYCFCFVLFWVFFVCLFVFFFFVCFCCVYVWFLFIYTCIRLLWFFYLFSIVFLKYDTSNDNHLRCINRLRHNYRCTLFIDGFRQFWKGVASLHDYFYQLLGRERGEGAIKNAKNDLFGKTCTTKNGRDATPQLSPKSAIALGTCTPHKNIPWGFLS